LRRLVAATPPSVAGTGSRWAAAFIAVVFAFGCGLMFSVMRAIGGWSLCSDAHLRAAERCFDGSAGAQAVSLISGWTSVLLGAITALLALAFAIRGRDRERELVACGLCALALAGVSVLVGSI
jgi:hypothetical protein